MKVNHHQIKNAIAYVSKLVEEEAPNKKLELLSAKHRGNGWSLEVDEPSPMLQPDGSIIYETFSDHRSPRYLAKFNEIGTDESISLDNLFIELFGLGQGIDAAWGFINHTDKFATASLLNILPASSYKKRFLGWELNYSGLDNKQEDIVLTIFTTRDGTIFELELNYSKTKKAIELAENFIKQSGQILDSKEIHRDYHRGDTGIHTLYYRGFNPQGDAVQLVLDVDAKNEIIRSHEITILKSNAK